MDNQVQLTLLVSTLASGCCHSIKTTSKYTTPPTGRLEGTEKTRDTLMDVTYFTTTEQRGLICDYLFPSTYFLPHKIIMFVIQWTMSVQPHVSSEEK